LHGSAESASLPQPKYTSITKDKTLIKTLAIALMIVCPLVWGLLVEWLFELRRRSAAGGESEEADIVE